MQKVALIVFLAFCDLVFSATECYFCLDSCPDPLQKFICEGGDGPFSCYTTTVTIENAKYIDKGCLPTAVAEAECNKINNIEGTSCRICDSDLCNAEQKEPLNCYLCEGSCETPVVHRCSEFLGWNVESVCLDASVETGGSTKYLKKCIAQEDIDLTCDIYKQLGGMCNTCNTSSCNTFKTNSYPTNVPHLQYVFGVVVVLFLTIFY